MHVDGQRFTHFGSSSLRVLSVGLLLDENENVD